MGCSAESQVLGEAEREVLRRLALLPCAKRRAVLTLVIAFTDEVAAGDE